LLGSGWWVGLQAGISARRAWRSKQHEACLQWAGGSSGGSPQGGTRGRGNRGNIVVAAACPRTAVPAAFQVAAACPRMAVQLLPAIRGSPSALWLQKGKRGGRQLQRSHGHPHSRKLWKNKSKPSSLVGIHAEVTLRAEHTFWRFHGLIVWWTCQRIGWLPGKPTLQKKRWPCPSGHHEPQHGETTRSLWPVATYCPSEVHQQIWVLAGGPWNFTRI